MSTAVRANPRPGAGYHAVPLASACMVSLVVSVLMFATSTGVDLTFVFPVLGAPIFTIIGAIILVRRPWHRIGRLMVVSGLALTASVGANVALAWADPHGPGSADVRAIVQGATNAVNVFALVSSSILLIVWFPDGRRSSRLGAIVEAVVVVSLLMLVVGTIWPPLTTAVGDSAFVIVGAAYGLAFVDLLRRYGREDAVRRAQIRWVMASAGLTVALIIATVTVGEQFDFIWGLWVISTLLPATAVGIAITRYHLYDIDRIVSNAVGYGLVSVILFGVFWGINLGLQQIVSRTIGAGPLVVAGSTLVVAVLFDPVRTRTQAIVDRRFHRAHYDAERLVASFSGRLRDELDLDHLAEELARTTAGAVEPTRASVWLRAGVSR